MARRSSTASMLAQYQREIARQARVAEREQKERERALAARQREEKRQHVEGRAAQVEELNADLDAEVAALAGILAATLSVDDYLPFESMKEEPEIPPFQPGALAIREPVPTLESFIPQPLSALRKLLPGAKSKYDAQVAEANERFRQAMEDDAARELQREAALAEARRQYDQEVGKIKARAEAQHGEIDAFRVRFEAGAPDAIVEYFSLVLDASSYPDDFPKTHKMAFVPESKQLVVEYQFPDVSIIPTDRQHRYVKARDAIEELPRPASQVKALYSRVVAETTVRTLHEVFEADRDARLETIVFNGYVETIDPATGKPISPHLVTVRASREIFLQLDLERVDPIACLKGLNASVSKSPAELVPVRPILEFNMVDPRFIQESDVLGELDQRPNLMELSPTEFESLISNLFEKMGLETRQTQASRDGGVDCVAYDPRPIFGGKVVIQAKRYKHTVGVSAVRDLFGTMQNEGASKGILVTTSGYGKSSFEFAEGKPLELLSGSHLLYLLAEHTGIEARIEPPEDWVDPIADAEEQIEHENDQPAKEAVRADG
jgi:restriction system protein